MRYAKRAAARNHQFRQDIKALLTGLGARPVCPEASYDFTLDTLAGELWLRAMDSDVEPWLGCRFRDAERARGRVSGALNPYSGKWNHMHSDVTLIRQRLMEILPSHCPLA